MDVSTVPQPLPPSPWGPPRQANQSDEIHQDSNIGSGVRRPLTMAELESIMALDPDDRAFNPYQCQWTEAVLLRTYGEPPPPHSSRVICHITIADPTRSRYCRKHAKELGVDFYDPATEIEMSVEEGHNTLYANVGTSIATMLEVMRDPDTPAGVRAKTAEAILDRTGFVRGVKVQAEVKVDDSDLAKTIHDRLERLAQSAVNVTIDGDGDAA